jgi:formamidopyrimidine-DNA glycosylase
MHATIKAEELSTDLIHSQAEKVRALQESLDDRFAAISESHEGKGPEGQNKEKVQQKEKKKNLCPHCFNPIEYYDRYRRWYCAYCMEYL